MFKGGYLMLDLSEIELGSETPVVIPGIYQKIKDTLGKPVLLTLSAGTYWASNVEVESGYGFITQIFNGETAFVPCAVSITDEDAVLTIIIEGGGE